MNADGRGKRVLVTSVAPPLLADLLGRALEDAGFDVLAPEGAESARAHASCDVVVTSVPPRSIALAAPVILLPQPDGPPSSGFVVLPYGSQRVRLNGVGDLVDLVERVCSRPAPS